MAVYQKQVTESIEAIQFTGFNEKEVKRFTNAVAIRRYGEEKNRDNPLPSRDAIEVEIHYPVQLDSVYYEHVRHGDMIVKLPNKVYNIKIMSREQFAKEYGEFSAVR